MPDDPNAPESPPQPIDGPEPDPVDAELIAYLDGELEPMAAHQVAVRLAADPELRARAAVLKRTFNLLDYLPKTEPSPNFTARTLDKLPTVKPAPQSQSVGSTPVPPSPSLSVPVLLASGESLLPESLPQMDFARGHRHWIWAVGVVFAVALALGAGYIGAAVTRAYVGSHRDNTNDLLANVRVIENLALYAVADDYSFIERLAGPDFFGDDPAVAFEGPPTRPVPEKPTGKQFDQLTKAFTAMSSERQAQIRQLDQQLHDKDGVPSHLFRVLEAYVVWLDRLADDDRQTVLTAPTTQQRLEEIHAIRRAQWIAQLPPPQRKQLESLPPVEQKALIALWKADENAGRGIWQTARAVAEMIRTGRQPWPFEDQNLRREALEFVKTVYRPDDPKRTRLYPTDAARLQEAIKRGEDSNEWFWLGHMIMDFNRPDPPQFGRQEPVRAARYELLPEPAVGHPITTIEDLKEYGAKHFRSGSPGRKQVSLFIGRWPDFAAAVSDYARDGKPLPDGISLGPSRPEAFRPEVRQAIGVLERRLNSFDANNLKQWEGKWPEYPRELIRLARWYDVVVPGVMPPGSPRKWEETYNPRRFGWPPRPGAGPGPNRGIGN